MACDNRCIGDDIFPAPCGTCDGRKPAAASAGSVPCCDIIGKALAGNGRLLDGRTLAEVKPDKYDNPLTDYVNLVIAEVKAKMSRD